MKILSLDYGRRNIGVSISDATKSIAFIRPSITNNEKCASLLQDIISTEKVETILIGKNQNANPNFDLNKEAQVFLKKLKLENTKIITVNEDYSTFEAINKLKDSGLKEDQINKFKDSVAAQIILEKYIQSIE